LEQGNLAKNVTNNRTNGRIVVGVPDRYNTFSGRWDEVSVSDFGTVKRK
jgi:hypothetical protein